MSNVLGTLTPVRQLTDAAHAAGALCLVDGAQYVPHLPTDVTELGCDFFGFTGHKMLGPTGIGVLWAREELLDAMPAFLGGGEMIRDVRLDGWTPNDIPVEVRGRHAADRRGDRARRRRRLPRRARHGPRCASTRSSSAATRCARWPTASATS